MNSIINKLKMTKIKEAFTLLELIMVVVLIAILTALAYPNYMAITERARAAEAISVLHALRNAQKTYYVEHQQPFVPYDHYYADNIAHLDITVGSLDYFYAPAIQTYAKTLIYLRRNTYKYPNLPEFAGRYTLYIGTFGRISCKDTVGVNPCDKIGY